MNDDMILDMDTFDFASIDSDTPEVAREMPKEFSFMDINDEEEDEYNIDIEDDADEVEEDVEEEDYEDTTSITDALSQLGAIDDEFELDFGTQKVSKGELVKLLGDRENIIKTREAIDGLGARMVGRETDIELFYTVSKTETDKQLEHVYSMLNDPDKWTSATDVAQLQKARIQLERRKTELDQTKEKAMEGIRAQKQELDTVRIQKVVAEMGSQAPLQEAAQYAEAKGIDLTALVAGCSPALVTALQNAKKYEELVNKNKTKLAATKEAKKPKSVAVRPKTSGKVTASDKQRAQKMYAAGKLSHSDMFKFLED